MKGSYTIAVFLLLYLSACSATDLARESTANGIDAQWELLSAEADQLGKPGWRPMLNFLCDMHRKGTHPARPPFPHPWEEIGPGYHALAFGHWDIVHVILDVLPTLRTHAKHQVLNNLANQEADGLIPGVIWIESPRGERSAPRWSTEAGHPPLWQIAVEDYSKLYGDELLPHSYEPLKLQIAWFERNRAAFPEGFYYSRTSWESGLDDDLRQPRAVRADGSFWSFLDATCHVYSMYDLASSWAGRLGKTEEAEHYSGKAERLKGFIQSRSFDEKVGYFHDIWAFEKPQNRIESFVGIWPLVTGAATNEQAQRVINEHLLNRERFSGKHPISTIALNAPEFELLMWRGPSWNSMTYWAARGCLRYGRPDAALRLVEAALDATAHQYDRTGTLWEFYDPGGGKPEKVKREVKPPQGTPRRDYTGHNPLFAMARMYDALAR